MVRVSIGYHDQCLTYISSVVYKCEVSLGSEARFGVFGVLTMFTMKLLHETLVSGLREPTFLIQEG